MRRVSIVGSSGSGKTTMAMAVASALGLRHLELDSVFHQPRWTEMPTDDLQERVQTLTDQDAWVVDGNYTSRGITDLVWNRADTAIWLDLSRWETQRRVVLRTLRRIAQREQLWNGNREGWHNLVDPRPDHNVILWTWTRYAHVRDKYALRFEDERWAALNLIRLRTPSEVNDFMDELGG